MMFKSLILAAALAASALAQTASVVTSSAASITATATQSMLPAATQGFNPGLVNRTLALAWCRAQRNTCPDICGGRVSRNDCDETAFTYSCICSNGTIPDCTAFEQTLPFYICDETYSQCLNIHPSTDPDGQQTCISNHKCGTRNATAERFASSSSVTTSASGNATSSATAAASSSTSRALGAIGAAPVSNGAFVAFLFALCKLFL